MECVGSHTKQPTHVKKIFDLGRGEMVQSSSSLVPLVSHSVQKVSSEVCRTTTFIWKARV